MRSPAASRRGGGASAPRGLGGDRRPPRALPAIATLLIVAAGCAVPVGCTATPGVTPAHNDATVGDAVINGCGRAIGDRICEVTLLGYGHPVAGAAPAFALDHQVGLLIDTAPRRHVLLLLGGAWCPSCKISTVMAVKRGHEVADHVTFINVLIEGDTPTKPARKSHIDAWLKAYQPRFAVVADAFETPLAARPALGLREAAVLVDRDDRRIIARAETLAKLWPQLGSFAAK